MTNYDHSNHVIGTLGGLVHWVLMLWAGWIIFLMVAWVLMTYPMICFLVFMTLVVYAAMWHRNFRFQRGKHV